MFVLKPQTVFLEQGQDELDFLFSANAGLKPDLISKTASGGELSRLMLAIKYLLATTKIIKKINKLPKKVKPIKSNTIPIAIGIQKPFFLNIADLGSSDFTSSWFMKSTANTGFMIKATTSDAAKVNINMAGR